MKMAANFMDFHTRGSRLWLYIQGQRKKGNPASGPEGTINSEPVNAYKYRKLFSANICDNLRLSFKFKEKGGDHGSRTSGEDPENR